MCLWSFIITAELNHFYKAFIWKVLYTDSGYGKEYSLSLGLISFLETAIKISLTHSRVLYLHSVLVLRPVTNTRLLMSTAKQTEQPHILPCLLVLPSHHAVPCCLCLAAEPRARQGFPLQPSRSWAGEQAAQAYGHITIYSKYTTSCLKAMILAVMFILGIKGKSCKALGGLLPAEPPASPSSGPLTKALSWKTQNTFIYLSIYLLKKKVWYIKI